MLAIPRHQTLGGRVLGGQGLVVTADRRGNLQGELLAELDTPLVEGIDTPHGTLHEGDVLVQGDEFSDCLLYTSDAADE